jgi:hypothetical protein
MLSVVYKLMTDPDKFLKFFLKQFRKYMKGCIARCTVVVGTLRTGYHHVQTSSQDNDSRLPAGGSFGAATWLRLGTAPGPPRAPAAPAFASRLRAAMCHLDSSTHLLAQGSSGAATCPEDGLCRP